MKETAINPQWKREIEIKYTAKRIKLLADYTEKKEQAQTSYLAKADKVLQDYSKETKAIKDLRQEISDSVHEAYMAVLDREKNGTPAEYYTAKVVLEEMKHTQHLQKLELAERMNLLDRRYVNEHAHIRQELDMELSRMKHLYEEQRFLISELECDEIDTARKEQGV